jgi:hypothetical protein
MSHTGTADGLSEVTEPLTANAAAIREDNRRSVTAPSSRTSSSNAGTGSAEPREPEAAPPIFRRLRGEVASDFSDERQLECKRICERAGAAFRVACESSDEESASAALAQSVACMDDLWSFEGLRGQSFLDVVGLLDATLRNREIACFSDQQRDILRVAFSDLKRAFLAESDVDELRKRFAEADIDVLRPLLQAKEQRIRIVLDDAV